MFVAEPFRWLPDSLTSTARADSVENDQNVRDLASYLLRTDAPPATRGRVGRSGEVTLRFTLTPGGRSKLLRAFDAQAAASARAGPSG